MELIKEIEHELDILGFKSKPLQELPDVIVRIYITINMAHLYYNEKHKVDLSDKKWLQYYSQYVHFFDCEKYENLGDLFYKLVNQLAKDIGFDPIA